MPQYTFDRSPALGLALVATAELRHPHYRPLDSAPNDHREIDRAYLRQLHAVANGAINGIIAQPRHALLPAHWERLGAEASR